MEQMKIQRHTNLSESLRADIMHVKGQMSQIEAAAKFGVSSETVRRLWKGIGSIPEDVKERRARFTDDEKQGVVRAFQSGKTVPEIALMYDASDRAIYKIIRKEIGSRRIQLTDKKKKDICRYYRLGWTFERIASELGVPAGTVACYISKQGLANRNAKRENPELKMAPVRLDGTRDYVRKFIRPEPIKKEDDQMDIEKSAISVVKSVTMTGKYVEVKACGDEVFAVTFIKNAEGDKSKFIEMARELEAIADLMEKGV